MCGNGLQSKDDQFKAIIVTNECAGCDTTLGFLSYSTVHLALYCVVDLLVVSHVFLYILARALSKAKWAALYNP
jgi:hypothetical protein